MMGLGMSELIIILVIALIIFWAGKLPEIGSSLGQSIQNFKKASEPEPPKPLPREEPKSPEGNQAGNQGSTQVNAQGFTDTKP